LFYPLNYGDKEICDCRLAILVHDANQVSRFPRHGREKLDNVASYL
jgi:hypothetical protein